MIVEALTKIAVIELRGKDVVLAKNISNLFEQNLGKNYTSAEEMAAMMRSRKAWVFGAFTEDGNLVGAATASNSDQDTIEDLNDVGWRLGRQTRVLPVDYRRVGMLDSCVVAKQFRGQGAGLALVERRTEFLAEKRKSHVVALSWHSGSAQSSASVLERAGFKLAFTIPRYWEKDTVDLGYECAKCGLTCTCDAKVYVKKV